MTGETGEGSARKLIVEVCNAKNLMPKDGQGTASAYATVEFDGQRRRTKTKLRDLNPEWDEKLEFLVHDPDSMASQTLELNLYNDNKKFGHRSNFLGKVKVAGSTFVISGSQSLVYYPLEKRSVFSQIKGEIGLKICYADPEDPPADQDPPPPAREKKEEGEEKKTQGKNKKEEEEAIEEKALKGNSPVEITNSGEAPAKEPSNPPLVAQVEKPKQCREESSSTTTTTQTTFKQTNDDLELRSISGSSSSSRYDLVDPMPFLYVRVVKAKRFCDDAGMATPVCASLVIGSRSIKTKTSSDNNDWDQVFAFRWEGLNSTTLEVSVLSEKNNDGDGDQNQDHQIGEICLGTVSFDLQEAPKRVPPDSPLASQWYTLEDSPEGSPRTDVMIAVWLGTQVDEAFQEAWQSDSGGFIPETRAKVYLSPKLWYLRLTVIQTQDLRLGSGPAPKVRNPELYLYVKAQLGGQIFKTARALAGGSENPTWNEDLVFVAAEPFEPFLVVTVEDFTNGHPVGHAKIHVSSVDRRTDEQAEPRSRWFNLIGEGDFNGGAYAGRIHVRACLEGGYHVADEAANVTSDVRAASKQLAKPAMGLLEVGIRGANNLLPVKTADGAHGTTDAYAVAKYGPKWVRTRTILDSFNPRWNEQYTWDVYDPCTVLTIGVFDNGRYDSKGGGGGKDARMGKLRIRLSTLDAGRVYSGSYSLAVFLPGGAKKMGEIEIAVRFSCASWLSLVQAYASPTLPRMHYVRPMGLAQQDILRQTAMRIVTARLARSEPPLGQEVVQVMLDADAHVWSMRRTKANWFRIMGWLTKAATVARWIHGIRTWAHVPTTVSVHALFVAVVVFFPHLVLPSVFMYVFLALSLRFRHRPRVQFDMDPRLSCVDAVGTEEMDEEFDGLPTNRSADQIRFRYDRLRALAGRAQILLGDLAAHGERLEALSSWRDPRATGIFVVFCLFASLMLYLVPFKAFVLCFGFYYLRHPRFRGDMPSVPVNFFRRLPSLSDRIL